MIHRAFRFKLKPTADQDRNMAQCAGVVRLVYNLALEQRRDWWRHYARQTGNRLNYVAQARELTALRAAHDFIRAVSQTCQQQALRDLDGAFSRFFSGKSGYPQPRKRGLDDSFRFQGREVTVERLNRNWGRVFLPKIGWVRLRLTRNLEGAIRNATVRRDALGWHVSLACEIEPGSVAADGPSTAATGIDRGVVHTLAFSDGTFADMPVERLKLLDRRARKHARALARCKKGSNRRTRVRARLAANKATAARIRKHFNHVQSHKIAKAYGTVVVEALKTASMTRSAKGTIDQPGRNVRAKAGLNRAILQQGWHQFATFLSYKLEAKGGFLIEVPAAYTSQTCAACASVSSTHRKSQAVFECCDCGHSAHADTNAAINILKAGTRPAHANGESAPLVRESRLAA